MISRVSSNNKGKQAKMKNSVKKQRNKKKVQRNRKQRRREVEHGISARASNSLTTAPQ